MFRLFDSISFALERIWQHRVLVLWALVGLTAATTLALSLPLYVDSVDTKLLSSRLSDPPYAFRFRYLGAWNGNIKQPDVTGATDAIMNTFTGTIGLPIQLQVSYVRGGPWTTRMTKNNSVLGTFSFGTLNGADSKMQIVAGQWPPKPGAVPSGTIPILISQNMLYTKGVGVGDALTVTQPTGKAIKGQIVAIWAPLNANDPAWIFPPKAFDEALLLQTADLWTVFQGVDKPVEESDWFVVFDGYGIRTADVSGLLDRINDGQRLVTEALPPIRLDLSPSDKLTAFLSDVTQLTEQLVVMILPVGGLVLYFVTLVAGLLVSRQQNEDVTLSSRGMSRRAILLIHLLMWLILAGIALTVGIAAAPTVVGLVGKTTSFLRFDNTDAPLEITFTPLALAAGAITGLLAASSGLIIAWRTTAQTITSFKQETARGSAAWWQRYYLDFLLLIPAYYELYSLNQRGGLHTTADNPFSDPLTFLGPTLFALGNTLLFLRIWPFLLRIAANIISYGRGISILMALRELTRSMKRYRGALLMMAFTLSLTGYTASMASTIDRTLEDSINYQIGADSVLVTAADTNTTSGAVDANTGQASQSVTGFNTLPAIGLKDIPGVDNVARVGTYPAQLKLPGKVIDGTVMGVDRDTMPAVTRWRQDYASMPIADLFNLLAPERTGLIIDANTLNTYKLKIGQILDWQVNALNQWYETKAPIVGVVNYFPTLDPRQKFFLITNIDPIWESVGSELPNDIWISLKPGTDPATVEQAASEKGYPVVEWKDPAVALHEALTAPTRRGVLGFLSIGFVASILLTLVGNIIQSTASFRAQAVQLGALRAMGLGSFAVAVYLIVSQGLAVVGGILGGTAIGAATTLLFLPLLDFGGGLPPYLVRVDWLSILTVYVVFAGVLLSITMFTTFMLGRERLFTVVKLGDAG